MSYLKFLSPALFLSLCCTTYGAALKSTIPPSDEMEQKIALAYVSSEASGIDALPPKQTAPKPVVAPKEPLFDEDDYDEMEFDNDSMPTFPADELYNFTWTSERLNPYRIPIDSLPDSVKIDCHNFVFPVASNRITSGFGMRHSRYHYGTDIGIATGDTVVAAFDGTIRIVDYERKGYGHYVVIRHSNGLESVSAHLSKVLVNLNQVVKAGEPIALGGSTGRSSGPHLHFELRFLGNAFNTTKLIDYNTQKAFADTYWLTKKHTYSHKTELKAMSAARYHKVRSGDTLSKIARRYGTTVGNLCRLNKIKQTTTLRVGKSIRYR